MAAISSDCGQLPLSIHRAHLAGPAHLLPSPGAPCHPLSVSADVPPPGVACGWNHTVSVILYLSISLGAMSSRFSPVAAGAGISFLFRAEYQSTRHTHTLCLSIHPGEHRRLPHLSSCAPRGCERGCNGHPSYKCKGWPDLRAVSSKHSNKRARKSSWALRPSSENSREATMHSKFTPSRGSPPEEEQS